MNAWRMVLVGVIALAGCTLRADDTSTVPFPGETTVVLDIGFGIRYVPPANVTVPTGETVTINAPAAMASMDLRWLKDGVALSGASGASLRLGSVSRGDAAVYVCQEASSAKPSQAVRLTVLPPNRFTNLSTRAFAGSGDQTFISGFVVDGVKDKKVLLRALGPALAKYGVAGALPEPQIAIFDSSGKPYTNGYAYAAVVGGLTYEKDIEQSTAAVGATPLPAGSKDAVELRPFHPGTYTIHVTGKNNTSGTTLLEVYEVP